MLNGLPDEVREFITANINSVAQLEVLLLLRRESGVAWSAEDVARALYTTPEMMAAQLAELETRGLLRKTSGSADVYSYAPSTPQLAAAVDLLANLYKERRVTVITTIYAEPVDSVRTFADAFRLRKDKPPSES
jgi:DNA-binding MarR family transcriptional regulator